MQRRAEHSGLLSLIIECQGVSPQIEGVWQRGSLRRPHVRANEDTFMIMLVRTH